MKKMIQAVPVFLNISILVFLFFVTAAPTAVEYGLVPNTKELRKSKINELWSPTPSCVISGCESENISPNTNNIGQVELNASDGIAAPANQGSMALQPQRNEGVHPETPSPVHTEHEGLGEACTPTCDLGFTNGTQELISPADGHDPGTKTPTFSNAADNHKLDKRISDNLGIDTSPPVAYQGGQSGNPLDLVGPISNEYKP